MLTKLTVIAAAFAIAVPATAVTTISNQKGAPDPGLPNGLTLVTDFDGFLLAGVTNVTSGDVYTGSASVDGDYAAPAQTAPGTNYQAVQTDGVSTFDFTNYLAPLADGIFLNRFSLYWGSIDTYNTLQFLSGDTVVKSFTGVDFPPADGRQPDDVTNRRITFGLTKADAITSVRFLSSKDAFEYDTLGISTNVPEPATWAMLIGGFGLVGASMRRRRSTMAHVIA